MKVYIVEDAPETRKDIANALAPMKDIEVVGEAESVRDARKGIYSSSPEAVILDIFLADGSGVEILKLIRFALSVGLSALLITRDTLSVDHGRSKVKLDLQPARKRRWQVPHRSMVRGIDCATQSQAPDTQSAPLQVDEEIHALCEALIASEGGVGP
jgi:CheY-like chemotaxis protein